MTKIQYRVGDATGPFPESGRVIIAHIVNDIGAWGSGFVLAVSARWPSPEAAYRKLAADHHQPILPMGHVQYVQVEPMLWVANMVAQRAMRSRTNPHPLHLDGLERCLADLAEVAASDNCTVVMPRIGCDRGGGTWDEVEPIIERTLCANGVSVMVYDLPS